MTGIAKHESGLDPAAIHYNRNGTFDAGLTQVNSSNFSWLGLMLKDALDPCKNLEAGAKVLLAKYNGSTGTVAAAYATDALAAIREVGAASPSAAMSSATPASADPPASSIFVRPGAGSALIVATNPHQ